MMSASTAAAHDDDHTLPTLASKGVESLFFSGLTNISEDRPLKGMNHFARVSVQAGGATKQGDGGGGVGGVGVGGLAGRSVRSGTGASIRSSGSKSVRSVFTEKKQEDIDRLFEDLLGQQSSSNTEGNNNSNSDAVSTASSVMSSVMPIIDTPLTLRRSGATGVSQRSVAASSVMSGAVIGSGGAGVGGGGVGGSGGGAGMSSNKNNLSTYAHNQYIFDDSQKKASSDPHDLIYGDDDSTKKLNYTLLDRFSRFYKGRHNRMLQARAGFILVILCSIMFVVLQTTVVHEHNREQMKNLREQYRVTTNRAIRPDYVTGGYDDLVKKDGLGTSEDLDVVMDSEGMDRPNSGIANMNAHPHSLEDSEKVFRVNDNGRDSLTKTTRMADGLYGTTANNDGLEKNDELLKTDFEAAPTDRVPDDGKELTAAALGGLQSDITIPKSFVNLVDVTEGVAPHREMPFFWQVPRAGGGTLRQILSECMGAVLAAEPGGEGPFAGDNTLEVIQVGKGMFVNVDTTFLGGIERAKELDLLTSRKADVIVSPYIFETTTIFTTQNPGRMFAFLRHPIERCASIYAYKRTVDPEIASMSLYDYARSGRVENNWMTRFLSNQLTGELTFDHVVIAKEILRTKCLIGLQEYLWASIKRFEHFYDWTYTKDPAVQYECRKQKLLEDIDMTEYDQPVVKEGTQEWTMLLWQNKFDMKLYKYAQELYQEQLKLFPDGFQ